VRLTGSPCTLVEYPAATTTNPQFESSNLAGLDRFFLPPAMSGLVDTEALAAREFLEDDHRGAVSPLPVATLDGLGFHLSIKGVGSTFDPFSDRALDASVARQLTEDASVRDRIDHPRGEPVRGEPERWITGERWLRGSPYGGQGLEHASIALRVSERADLTSLAGFRIAPVVKIARFPPDLEERIRSLHWYRRFRGPIVQELRLVPSNVRIYFHARHTIGHSVRSVFDQFGIGSNPTAIAFEVAFVRSTLAMLTLFARTLRPDATEGRYRGLDFHDVWLDKDAVVAPDGTVFFVDLEGVEEESVPREGVAEKLEDQVYRSLYEFLYAYEQLDQERVRRFGHESSRKAQLEGLVREAVRDDRFLRLRETPEGASLEIRNALGEEDLNTTFPLLDR
jgi:hypothetical protein